MVKWLGFVVTNIVYNRKLLFHFDDLSKRNKIANIACRTVQCTVLIWIDYFFKKKKNIPFIEKTESQLLLRNICVEIPVFR